ncbi:hypothetical protein V6N12_054018 [Hibiscus sabdariffa]|uniref:CW-type domain-containing protein n=1 Tax=Hibiscus sabdariffa TaxID=183260 RepID=A0ABR2D9A1_9ROSI
MSVEKNDFLVEMKSGDNKVKDRRIARCKGTHDAALKESMEPIFTQEVHCENPIIGLTQKALEEQKTSIPYYVRKNIKRWERQFEFACYKQLIISLLLEKRISKGSHCHGNLAVETPKERMRVGSSLMLENKLITYAKKYIDKMESRDQKSKSSSQKNEDSYRDIREPEHDANQIRSPEIDSKDWLIEVDKFRGKHISNKIVDLLANKSYPGAVMDCASSSDNVNVAKTSVAIVALVLIKENCVCCDRCKKWYLLPISINLADLPDKWQCTLLNWIIDEEETTKVGFVMYQVLDAHDRIDLQSNFGSIMPRLPSVDTLQPDQNQRSFGSHGMPTTGRKKHILG